MSKKPYKAEGWENIVVNDADGNTLVACAGSTLEEAKANAALFAAAPELMAELQNAVRCAERDGMPGNPGSAPCWVISARAALDKATSV